MEGFAIERQTTFQEKASKSSGIEFTYEALLGVTFRNRRLRVESKYNIELSCRAVSAMPTFDLLALTNTAYQKEKATSSKKGGLSEIWLPRRDETGHCELLVPL